MFRVVFFVASPYSFRLLEIQKVICHLLFILLEYLNLSPQGVRLFRLISFDIRPNIGDQRYKLGVEHWDIKDNAISMSFIFSNQNNHILDLSVFMFGILYRQINHR